jgi:hypothetical protein
MHLICQDKQCNICKVVAARLRVVVLTDLQDSVRIGSIVAKNSADYNKALADVMELIDSRLEKL